MEIALENFFEVKVNATQLSSFVQKTNKQLAEHKILLDQLTKTMAMASSKQREDYMIEIEKTRRINEQERNYMKLYMKDIDKKSMEKDSQLQNSVAALSIHINNIKAYLQEQTNTKLGVLERKIDYDKINSLQEVVKAEAVQVRSLFELVHQKHKILQEKVDKNQVSNKQMQENIFDKIKALPVSEKVESLQESQDDEHKLTSRRPKRKERRDMQFEQSFGWMAERIDDVQQRVEGQGQRRSILAHNKIVKNTAEKPSNFQKLAVAKQQGRHKDFQKAIMAKLQKIQEAAVQKMALFEKYVNRVDNKNEIIDQHISILSRKLEKEKTRINTISESIRMITDRRVDQQVIEAIKNSIKKLTKDTQQALQQKVNQQVYNKEKAKLADRTNHIYEAMMDKAQKVDLRKGLTFLQQKIKQIIIVLAQEKQQNQDGAVKKTPFKCLSCDKDLQLQKENGANLKQKETVMNMRCSTTQMRKRVRVINNSIGSLPIHDQM